MTAKRGGAHNKARIIAVIGSTGMGKGWHIKTDLLPKLKQVFIWSPLEFSDNYAGVVGVRPVSRIGDLIEEGRAGRSVVFVPSDDPKVMAAEFQLFCRAVWHFDGAAVEVEELAGVTSPSHAVPPWKKLSTQCRHKGMTLIGASQRPAQIDKDFLGGTTEIRCFRLMYENDAKVMAAVLRVDWRHIMDLPDHHFIHRNMSKRVNIYGAMTGERFKSLEDMAGVVTPAKTTISAKKVSRPAPG